MADTIPKSPERRPSLPPAARRRAALVTLGTSYAAVALTIIQGFLLTPLCVAKIPLALYGAWLATGNILAWIELVDPGISNMLQQRVAFTYGAGDAGRLGKVIGTGMLLLLGLACMPLAAWTMAPGLANLVNCPAQHADSLAAAFRLGLLSLSVSLVAYGLSSVSLGLQLAATSGTSFVIGGALGIAATFLLLLSGAGLIALPVGSLVRSSVVLAWNGIRVAAWSSRHLASLPSFSRDEARRVAGLSTWTALARLGTALLTNVDAVIASRLFGADAVPVLVLTGRAFEPIRLLTDRMGNAIMPGFAHLAGENERTRAVEVLSRVRQVAGWVSAVGVAGVIAMNETFMSIWVGQRIFGGHGLNVLLGSAAALATMSFILGQVAFGLGAVRQTSLASLAEAMVKVPLQVLMGWALGISGLPLATCLSVIAVRMWYLPHLTGTLLGVSGRGELFAWLGNLKKVALLGLVGGTAGLGLHRLGIAWTWPRFAGATVLAAAVLGTVLLIGDRQLRESVRRWRTT